MVVIPESFVAAQREAFQDKTVTLYAATPQTEAGFGTYGTKPNSAPLLTAAVNWQPVDNEVQARVYGLRLAKDATFTTSEPLPSVEPGAFAQYAGKWYRVKELLAYDSHTRALCEGVTVTWDSTVVST